ncbi:MAG: hypothetical protein UW81_C0038G0011, partial [Candidatus Giovannonibacteria bacterium GW2011_GWC2_44_9]
MGKILDLPGIGPGPHPCHGCVIPFYYRPVLKIINNPSINKIVDVIAEA